MSEMKRKGLLIVVSAGSGAGKSTLCRAVARLLPPELVVRGLSRLLHNQRALYLKRLLLFEPRVILASVPYQLMR